MKDARNSFDYIELTSKQYILRNHRVKRLNELTAAISLTINNKDVVRLECARSGIPVCWCQSFSTCSWKETHTHTHVNTHRRVTSSSKVSKGHSGLTLILILGPPNIISTVFVPSRRAYTQKKYPRAHTCWRTIIILSPIWLYFKLCWSHRGDGGILYFFLNNLPRSFSNNVIYFLTISSNQVSFQSHNSFLWHWKRVTPQSRLSAVFAINPVQTLSFANSYFVMVYVLVGMHDWGADYGFFSYWSKDRVSVIAGFLMFNGTGFCFLHTLW